MCNSFFQIFLKKFSRGKIHSLFWGLNEIFLRNWVQSGQKASRSFFSVDAKELTGQRILSLCHAFICLWRDSSLLRGNWGGASLRNRSPLPWCSKCARVCSNLFRRARIRAHACSKVEHAKSRTKVRLFCVSYMYICIYNYLVSLKTSRFLTQ